MTLPNPHTWLRLRTKNSDKVSYPIKSTFFFFPASDEFEIW